MRRPSAVPVVLGCLVLATLSVVVVPSAPTYDPTAWLVWGREIAHGGLSTTTGPSWKPLPMLVLVPSGLLGGLAPGVWLVVTRAAALGTLWLVWMLASRLGRGPVAGAVAVGALVLAPWQVGNAWLGNSESLVTLLGLGAVLDVLDGRGRRAFTWTLGLALLRPESWPWCALCGLWLLRRDRGALGLVAAGAVLVPAAWCLPELIGSGDALRAVRRAQEVTAGTAGATAHPRLAVLRQEAGLLSPTAFAGLALLLVGLPRWREPGRLAAFALLGLAVAWTLVVVEMTAGGFSGATRYLIAPLALLCVLAGVGAGWAVDALRVPGRLVPAVAVVLALVAAVPMLRDQPALWRDLRHQGELADQLPRAIDRAGGRDRLLACGRPGTTALLVPEVAWALDVRLRDVSPLPGRDDLLLSGEVQRGQPRDPVTWPSLLTGSRVLAETPAWQLVGRC